MTSQHPPKSTANHSADHSTVDCEIGLVPGAELPAELWTAAIAAAGDRVALEQRGMPSPVLMERASLSVAHELLPLWAAAQRTAQAAVPVIVPVIVLVGPGNNGADGLAIARILCGWGVLAQAWLVTQHRNPAAQRQLERCRAYGVEVVELGVGVHLDGWPQIVPPIAVWVDAMLGTGATGPPRAAIAHALAALSQVRGPKVAVDLPSGVQIDSGQAHEHAFAAELCVTFERSKPGLHITPGKHHATRVVVASVLGLGSWPQSSLDADSVHSLALVTPRWARARLALLQAAPAHKGQRGHVAILGGSPTTPGAAILAALGAMRSGAGLATLVAACPDTATALRAGMVPELMLASWATPLAPSAHALVVGPGLTAAAAHHGALEALYLDETRPVVVDASALQTVPVAGRTPRGPRVLTPHPGEAAQLLQRIQPERQWSSASVQAQRLEAAQRIAAATQAVVVLKGEGTIVAAPESEGCRASVRVVLRGDASLATAGSGDVLAGSVGAFLGRGLDAMTAAALAAHVHGIAGELAGLRDPNPMASDIVMMLGPALVQARAGGPSPKVPRVRLG